MAKGRKIKVGVITGTEQVLYQAGRMHHAMLPEARRGSGAWKDDKVYDRKKVKREFRDASDYGRVAKESDDSAVD